MTTAPHLEYTIIAVLKYVLLIAVFIIIAEYILRSNYFYTRFYFKN